jgi:tRNA threonylcarbamoyladenosine biosynthesis protein TsaE
MITFDAELTLHSDGPEATIQLGRCLGESCEPGLVIALIGPLGAGKTQLVRGISQGLGIADSRVVSSPTFVLVQEYDARLPIYHFDAYRLAGADQFGALGPEEYFFGEGVSIVEWADRVAACMPRERLEIAIDVYPASRRILHCRSIGALATGVLARCKRAAS